MWRFAFVSFFIAIVLVTLFHWVFYDLLIKIQSKKFYFDWVKDGKPIGMFHTPESIPTIRGSMSRNRLMLRWIFQKPDWVNRDEKAERFYKYFRLSGITYISLILFALASFIVIFLSQP